MTQTLEEVKAQDDDFELINRLKGLYTIARDAKRSNYESWQRNYRLVHNRTAARPAQSWMPVPRDSEIYPACATNVSWMADQNTRIEYVAASNPGSQYFTVIQDLANDLTTVVRTNWTALNYRAQIKLVLWDALIYSVGYFKTVWDQALDDGLGNVMLKRIDPWALYIDPNATSLDDAEYIIEARRMTIDEIERRWPNHAERVSESGGETELDGAPDRTGSPTTVMSNIGNLQLGSTTRWGMPKKNMVGKLNPKDTITVYEFWLKENDEWADGELDDPALSENHVEQKWRVVVIAANTVLMNEQADDLWSGGWHPYDRYLWDDIGELYGISLVDHLSSPQIYINRLLTAVQHNAELTGNPILIEPKNAGTDRIGMVSRPGTRLPVNPAAAQSGSGLRWLDPPSMSPDVQKLVEFWINRLDNISGMSAVVKGGQLTGGGRTPEGVINTIQEAAFVRIRNALSNLEGTLTSVARKMADLIIDNYTEQRYIASVGESGGQSSKLLNANHFQLGKGKNMPLQYAISVDVGASAPTSRQARMAESDMALALGAIDRVAWLEAHNYPNREAIAKRITDMEAVGTFQAPGARQRAGRTS